MSVECVVVESSTKSDITLLLMLHNKSRQREREREMFFLVFSFTVCSMWPLMHLFPLVASRTTKTNFAAKNQMNCETSQQPNEMNLRSVGRCSTHKYIILLCRNLVITTWCTLEYKSTSIY